MGPSVDNSITLALSVVKEKATGCTAPSERDPATLSQTSAVHSLGTGLSAR